jgi:hypothetical protein
MEGNELADKLANDGANRPEVDHDIWLEIREEYSNVERYVGKLWQKEWEDAPTGAFYRRIEPNVRGPAQIVLIPIAQHGEHGTPFATWSMLGERMSPQSGRARVGALRRMPRPRDGPEFSAGLFR